MLVPPATVDEWFLCGPFELVQLCRDALAAAGVPHRDVRYELFTTDADAPRTDRGRPVVAERGDATVTIEFTLDGLSSTVERRSRANESILDAALRVRGRRAVRVRGRRVRHVPGAASSRAACR